MSQSNDEKAIYPRLFICCFLAWAISSYSLGVNFYHPVWSLGWHGISLYQNLVSKRTVRNLFKIGECLKSTLYLLSQDTWQLNAEKCSKCFLKMSFQLLPLHQSISSFCKFRVPTMDTFEKLKISLFSHFKNFNQFVKVLSLIKFWYKCIWMGWKGFDCLPILIQMEYTLL